MIYRDKSVGNLIRISVVKLVLLKAGIIIANTHFLFKYKILKECFQNSTLVQDYESFSPPGSRSSKSQSVSASDMLKRFCKWQSQLTSDREYYDVALLLTRYGLISNVQHLTFPARVKSSLFYLLD